MKTFEEIYSKYYPKVLSFLIFKLTYTNKELAEETANDIFMKVYENLKDFDGKNLTAWIYSITNNKLVDVVRHLKKERQVKYSSMYVTQDDGTEINLVEKIESSFSASRTLELSEIKTILTMAMNKALKDKEREMLTLRYIDGLKNEEIANKMGLTIGTVKGTIHRAVYKLEEYIPHNII